MPNWAYNSMTVRSTAESKQTAIHDLQEFLEFIKVTDPETGKVGYDLTKAHPMPEALVGTRSPAPSSPEPHENWVTMLEEGTMTQERFDELCAENIKFYEQGQKAYAETGYTDWYDWANNEWGTKWPPRFEHDDPELSEEFAQISMYYETAWSPASGLVTKMSERFPNLVFEVSVTEEANLYVGASRFHNGKAIEFYCSFDDKVLPESFRKRYDEICEAETKDDHDWDEYFEKMSDLQSDVLEYCETQVALMTSWEVEV